MNSESLREVDIEIKKINEEISKLEKEEEIDNFINISKKSQKFSNLPNCVNPQIPSGMERAPPSIPLDHPFKSERIREIEEEGKNYLISKLNENIQNIKTRIENHSKIEFRSKEGKVFSKLPGTGEIVESPEFRNKINKQLIHQIFI
jgi:hypothetical protein